MHFPTLELPRFVKVNYFHELDYIVEFVKQLGAEIKVEYVSFDGEQYVGIAYKEKDKDYYKLMGNDISKCSMPDYCRKD